MSAGERAAPHQLLERSCLVSKGTSRRRGSNEWHLSKSHKNRLRRAARPIVEGLENRRLLSAVGTADRAYTIGLLGSSDDVPTAVLRDGNVVVVAGLQGVSGNVLMAR